jgi:hypothetical protein
VSTWSDAMDAVGSSLKPKAMKYGSPEFMKGQRRRYENARNQYFFAASFAFKSKEQQEAIPADSASAAIAELSPSSAEELLRTIRTSNGGHGAWFLDSDDGTGDRMRQLDPRVDPSRLHLSRQISALRPQLFQYLDHKKAYPSPHLLTSAATPRRSCSKQRRSKQYRHAAPPSAGRWRRNRCRPERG